MKKKIKVLQVIPRLGYGGAETGCYDLAHFLPEQGFKSFIVTSDGELLKYINKKKVKVFKLPVQSKNPILILFNTIMIFFIILFNNINIVHARSRAPAWSSFFAARLSGKKFVTPLSISSLSKSKVYSNIFDSEKEAEMDHISLSRWCDIILFAPITENSIAKLAFGKANDLASTIILASNKRTECRFLYWVGGLA